MNTTVITGSPPSTLWRLRKDGQWIECAARLLAVGIEITVASNGALLYSRTFSTSDEAMAFAEDERQQRG